MSGVPATGVASESVLPVITVCGAVVVSFDLMWASVFLCYMFLLVRVYSRVWTSGNIVVVVLTFTWYSYSVSYLAINQSFIINNMY